MRPSLLLVVGVFLCAPPQIASAQRARSDSARLTALVARSERGDAAAHRSLEADGWLLVKTTATTGRLDPAHSRDLARIGIEMAAPWHSLEEPTEARDRVWRSATIQALNDALTGDPGDLWSAEQLQRLVPYPYIWAAPEQELRVLRALAARHPDLSPALRALTVRIELEVGSADSAAAAFAQITPATLTDAARGHLGAEVAFALGHDSAGAAAYYDGAAAIRDSTDAAWYSRDLAWIAQPAELDHWNALLPSAREAWLETFWNRRDIEDGRLPGSRLPEQFRRWRIVLRDYRWIYDATTARGVPVPAEDGAEYLPGDEAFPRDPAISPLVYRNRQRPLTVVIDDRGGLILRHGDPTLVSNLPGGTNLLEQVLAWDTPDGRLVVGFSRASFPDAPASERFGMFARNYPPGDLMSNCALDPRLCILAGLVESGASAAAVVMADRLLTEYTAMRVTAEHTDDNRESFPRPLYASVQAFGIPGEGALVVFAVPARRLDPKAVSAFAARIRIVIGDPLTGAFASVIDTVRQWTLKSPVNDDTQLTGYLLVPTPPGTWTVNGVISDPLRHAGTGRQVLAVSTKPFDQSFQLSDLILGAPDGDLSWFHGGEPIPLNPRDRWRRGDVATISYTVDGLKPGATYQTTVELRRTSHPDSLTTSIAFPSQASGTRMSFQRELTLAGLTPDDYEVLVRVTDPATGTIISRAGLLHVRP
ncbi:MAG TPA: hypothetical protein VGM77_12575 [Gemmatimonadales bacterium]|jgi:hypothetical protein